jgi:hypothetical protein
MQPHSLLWHYLWIGPHVLQAVIVGIMLMRGMQRRYPVFLTYLAVDCIENVALFVADHAPAAISDDQWWQMMWVSTLSTTILKFALIYEIFGQIFRPYPSLDRMGRSLLRWTCVALLLVGAVMAARTPTNVVPFLASGVQTVTCVVNLIQAGMVVALFVFAEYFGLTLKSFVFGIILGLGISASVNLAVLGVGMSFPGNDYAKQVNFLLMLTYHVSVLVWLSYSLVPAGATQPVRVIPENNLQRWDTELERLLTR